MRSMIALAALVAALPVQSGGQQPEPWTATLAQNGAVTLSRPGRTLGALEPGLFEAVWRGASLGGGRPGDEVRGPRRNGTITAPGGGVVDVAVTIAEATEHGLALRYRMTPRSGLKLNSLHVTLGLPVAWARGGSWVADGKAGAFPAELRDVQFRSGPVTRLALKGPDGAALTFAFAEPTPALLQDDRQWGGAFSLRIGPQISGDDVWPAGKALGIAFRIEAERGFRMEEDAPVTLQPGKEWAPLEASLDIEAGSALDFSAIVPWHVPAGKLGRVVTGPGGSFAFASEPKKPVRFYGVNLCFSAHYLSREETDRLAVRLRRLGYNALRIHHYESMLVDRSGGNSVTLTPAVLDQLDYLFAALKKQGIYVTTDLYVSRPVFAAEVWPGEAGDVGMDEFKMAVPVNERAYANYMAFARALLTHVNPYTGMKWGDDPTLAWLSLINEGNPGNFISGLSERCLNDYKAAYRTSLAANGLAGGPDLPNEGAHVNRFLADNQRAFYRRAKADLRDTLGCKALLTNMNAWTNPQAIQSVRSEFDYVDDHFYVDHPEFIERPWSLPSKCPNTSPVAAGVPGGRGCAFVRVLGKPFTCSEFNYSGPGKYRGVGGILTGALGAVQDWSIIWRFAYAHNREAVTAPRPAGYFDLASDPLNQAADRASVCLFRRGDIRASSPAVAVQTAARPQSTRGTTPPWDALAWVVRVGAAFSSVAGNTMALAAEGADGADGPAFAAGASERILRDLRSQGRLSAANRTDLGRTLLQSESGELTIDGQRDVLTIDTPRTAGGFANPGETVTGADMKAKVMDAPATVWVSSVDGQPIRRSRRLLVTHLTDLQNQGVRYADSARRVLLEWGGLPHLVRAGRAELSVRVADPSKARVWELAQSGKRLAVVPHTVRGEYVVVALNTVAGGKGRKLYEIAEK